ncbi:MAG TPA: enoyl-CoA hydratase-related protein [Acidimicrobiia bacterium]|jgi:enoyl-CoA hydratase/carnithine racemase|nr:enoyl-CoA hydratase-related protein [Acidimicrobiia bacterium]
MDEIRIERDGGVVRVTLNRPDKLNAQTVEMWHHLAKVGADLATDDSIRVLVVAGEGRAFSAGIDITTFTAPPARDGARANGDAGEPPVRSDVDGILAIQKAFSWLEAAPYPTIAKVQGHAYGAGMQLALACDLRIAADDARMGLLETNWGLMPDLGGTVWLPRLVGPAKALELMLTATKLAADELLTLGIVNRVVPRAELDRTIDDLVAELLRRPPLALQGAKYAVRGGWGQSTDAGMLAAAEAQLRCLTSNDFVEAGRAFVEGREPAFEGR